MGRQTDAGAVGIPMDDTPFGMRVGGRMLQGLKIRILASIGVATAGAVFIALYLGFLAERFPWYSNLAVVLSALFVIPALLAGLWIHWGIAFARRFTRRFGDSDW
jgi:hypothetical protein